MCTLSLAAGSKVNVSGAWDNSGQSFTFNAATGSWTLNGGSITGGSIGFADGKNLLISANGANLLSGVTVNGDLTLNTTSAVTTAGILAITGNLTLAPTSTVQIEIGGTTPGTQYDQLHATGQLALGGHGYSWMRETI